MQTIALPVFSSKAARKVKEKMPIPTECPHCGAGVHFANNAEVYGRAYGDWPWLYRCENSACRAYVGAHPYTNIPLGTLATAEIREARKRAKELFNPLWMGGRMDRTEAYGWLASKMGIPVAACHFGWFDVAQCNKAIEVLTAPIEQGKQRTAKDFAALRQLLARE